MSENALQPIQQKQVSFYDDEITAVQVIIDDQEKIYVPVRPICEFLGVSWTGQSRRIKRDPVLADEICSVNVTFTEPNRSRQIAMSCLPLDFISGFLFGINASRVKPEIKDKLIRYQRECYQILAQAFQEGRLTPNPSFSELLKADSEAAQAYKIAIAVAKLAQHQLLLESRLDAHDSQFAAYETRLEQLEAQLGDPNRHITPEQATRISQVVKAIAMELSKKSGRNEYGGVYGELYRRYEIPSYRELPAHKYEDAISWLNDWLQTLSSDLPF